MRGFIIALFISAICFILNNPYIIEDWLCFFQSIQKKANDKDTNWDDVVSQSEAPMVTLSPAPTPTTPLPLEIANHPESKYGQAVDRLTPNHLINEKVDWESTFAWEVNTHNE